MSTLFISDLHLDESRPDITEAFFTFLQDRVPGAGALYILGDLFEVWLGDDDERAFHESIVSALAAVDVPGYVMHGNRDFLLGEAFCRKTGFTLLPDPVVIDLYGQPVLLMHGDSLCTRDTAYMKARKMLRDERFQADFLSKPLAERGAIAADARQQSSAHTRETAADIMDVTPEEVDHALRAHGVRLLIHGHTHRPAIHDLRVDGEDCRRIVLGDWDEKGWVLEVTAEGQDLVSFPLAVDRWSGGNPL